jgi:hypothetical protein
MTAYAKFKRQPLPSQLQQQMQTTTIPAPTRGIIMNENEAFMQPGGAIVCDNWAPTMRGVKLRGGCVRWATLPENTPVISGFEFISGNNQRIFAGNATKLYDVTTSTPVLIKSGQLSGNYVASQMANQGTPPDHMLVCNDAGDYVLHFDGTTWTTFNAGQITYAGGGTTTATGHNLTYVWKYRGRFYFIEGGTMNAYCLGINAYQGALNLIPLAGACTKGGKLLFGATWSVDAGDGIDDKCVFGTDQGELLIFTGSNPTDPNNWRQEGRYAISPPMGMNAHIGVGGDLLMMSVDGIVPISASITMSPGQLELAAITRQIKPMWRDEVNAKRSWSWTMKKWDEYGGIFVTWPGGSPGNRYCAVINNATGAWCRFVGWDATCFMRLRGDMFFGTQDGYIMQADRTGYDDGKPYVATLVGGWEMFQSPSETITWRQSRAAFTSGSGEPFQPQLAACTDYVVTLPTPPPAGPDPGLADVWDQGLWDQAKWDQPSVGRAPVRNTMWVSIGQTGFSHAPVVQVTVGQQAKPNVELISIAATFDRLGVNV